MRHQKRTISGLLYFLLPAFSDASACCQTVTVTVNHLKCFLVKFPPGFEIGLTPDLFNVPSYFQQEAKGEFADLNGKYLLIEDQGIKPNPICVDG